MAVKFKNFIDLYEMVSFASYGECSGYICKKTGQTWFHSEYGDNFKELPEDVHNNEQYLEVPHKNDLNLGQDLIFRYIAGELPDEYDNIRGFFRRRGAYANFKELLMRNDMLDHWHEFENKSTKTAVREWCEMEGIELID